MNDIQTYDPDKSYTGIEKYSMKMFGSQLRFYLNSEIISLTLEHRSVIFGMLLTLNYSLRDRIYIITRNNDLYEFFIDRYEFLEKVFIIDLGSEPVFVESDIPSISNALDSWEVTL